MHDLVLRVWAAAYPHSRPFPNDETLTSRITIGGLELRLGGMARVLPVSHNAQVLTPNEQPEDEVCRARY